MHLTIHRGTHEIGGSCVEITTQNSRIIIDIGIPLVKSNGEKFNANDYENLSGQELLERKVLPDIHGLYKWDMHEKTIDGLLISHPHMDHYGFYKYVREDITFYLGEGAKRIIDLTSIFTPTKGEIHKYSALKSGTSFIMGDFKITSYLMDHSAFDSYAFLIEAEGKKIIYSGDFRSHGRKSRAFYYFLNAAPKNIDALIMEGTMLGRDDERCITEDEIEEEIVKIINNSSGIVFANLSSQNIDRLVSLYRAAKRTERIFVIDVYTANILYALKDLAGIPYPSFKFPDIRVFFPWALTKKMFNEGNGILALRFSKYKIKREEINKNGSSIVMIVRPKMEKDLDCINVLKGGTFIYSLWKGYIEGANTKALLDYVNSKNMNIYMLHTSGHADIPTLKMVVNRLEPKNIIPIHTFYPDMFSMFNENVIKLNDNEPYQL